MKNIAKRAGVLYALAAAFIVGLVILTAQFAVNGGAWSSNRFNRHIYTRGQIASAGAITDRNGEVLAKSDGGKRLYHESRAVRKATLHAVGDTEGFISTGIQSAYRQELTGYSFLNGIYTLKKYGRGSDIRLTLDANACAAAYNALDGRKGTVGVYNYKTGELLCMVSAPSYDVNNKPSAMALASQEKYEGVYLNRFLSGLYTPGSTFKVVTAA
ncbi:MAG TPA: penicillin-binding transpeptidase domain-containing protein, partial [Clostridiales bacterium]|nr:penicillin-binding transpeptidase domain-containing protein [Clostridiales bacterium]